MTISLTPELQSSLKTWCQRRLNFDPPEGQYYVGDNTWSQNLAHPALSIEMAARPQVVRQ
jgi:hypothetical protein